MKKQRPFLHENKDNLKPMFVYSANSLFDINSILGNKSKVYHATLQSGLLIVFYKD